MQVSQLKLGEYSDEGTVLFGGAQGMPFCVKMDRVACSRARLGTILLGLVRVLIIVQGCSGLDVPRYKEERSTAWYYVHILRAFYVPSVPRAGLANRLYLLT